MPGVWVSFIDPGIRVTGLATYHILRLPGKLTYKLIPELTVKVKTVENPDPLIRALAMGQVIANALEGSKVSRVFMEIPPDTVYMGGKQKSDERSSQETYDYSVGRLTSLFRTFLAIGAIGQAISAMPRRPIIETFKPYQWEALGNEKQGMPVKQWSLLSAQMVADLHGMNGLSLSTKEDENLADAITMGWRWIEGKLRPPTPPKPKKKKGDPKLSSGKSGGASHRGYGKNPLRHPRAS